MCHDFQWNWGETQTWGKASLFQIQVFKILATKGIEGGRGGGVKPSHWTSHKAQNGTYLLRSAAKQTVKYLVKVTYTIYFWAFLLPTFVGHPRLCSESFLWKIYFYSRDPLCVFIQLGLELDYKAAFFSRIPLAVHELFRQTQVFFQGSLSTKFQFPFIRYMNPLLPPERLPWNSPYQDIYSWWDGRINAAAISIDSQKHQELTTSCLQNQYFGGGWGHWFNLTQGMGSKLMYTPMDDLGINYSHWGENSSHPRKKA